MRSYNRDMQSLFGGPVTSIEETKRRVDGNIVVMPGLGSPAPASLIEEWSGLGLIAVDPGAHIH